MAPTPPRSCLIQMAIPDIVIVANEHICRLYMAKYYDTRQHQLSRMSHMREGAREMYSKEQADFQVT